MTDWRSVRDWEVLEAVSDLSENSYDLVGRDFPLGDAEAHFLQYRKENYLVEAGFFYSGDQEDAMNELAEAREALKDKGFSTRLFLENADAARIGYEPELEGEYFFDSKASAEAIKTDLEDVMPSGVDFSDLSEIRCKK